MKSLYKAAVLTLTLAGTLTSCDKFLDVVPDERTKFEDTFADEGKGRDFLYSCFAYLPNPALTPAGLDMMTGDEVITAFEHETFSRFPKGSFSPSDPVISYWNQLYRGVRQCYQFMEHIDQIPDTTDEDKAEYRAQAKFAIALYHFHLFRCYGPIALIKELLPVTLKEEDYPVREPLDVCVKWIADKFDEAAEGLPAKQTQQARFGLGSKVAAKAFKAKLLVYAASPLFNGGSDLYKGFADKEGTELMPANYDPQKWVVAKQAVKEAIELATNTGYSLYIRDNYKADQNKWPENGVQRRMMSLIHDYDAEHPEVIYADTRGPGNWDLQLKSAPRAIDKHNNGANGISPTWSMLNRFYTADGLPWDEDPKTKEFATDDKKVELVSIPNESKIAKPGRRTMRFNLGREPRFYAWVTFQNGYFEIREEQAETYPDNNSGKFERSGQSGRAICDFTLNGEQGKRQRTNNYSPGGYLNKKGCPPDLGMTKGGPKQKGHPWPIIRLADLYLLQAEAAVETNDLEEAKTALDKVRERAGIPKVAEAWAKVPGVTLDQNKLRQIVRQERQIEFYLENQNFWDMRRWLLAGDAFNHKHKGLDIQATNIEGLAKLKEIAFERKFEPYHYLLPIPLGEIEKSRKLVQNPGY